jgi:hypothetical protein
MKYEIIRDLMGGTYRIHKDEEYVQRLDQEPWFEAALKT